MDPARFDQFSKRFAMRRLSRRPALRMLGAAGLAAALLSARHEHAAADCPDIAVCVYSGRGVLGLEGFAQMPIPGGPYGSC